uniref:Uncharacterized protein n=1 Tax=Candidatus Enterococcus clewellii TaxID=1834193 RepID=A0A242K2E7_9ENTE|nr:hypothetical protein [Enterococcus sp. 9E7_DIV0242]OTP12676.1 hypothetical protein A5888_003254 [Enterococcus sp. 9E7_DIV0242]
MAIEKIAIDRKSLKATEKELAQISSQIKRLNKEKLDVKMDMKTMRETSVEIETMNTQLENLSSKKAVINTDAKNITETNMQLIQLNETIQHMESVDISLDVAVDLGNVAMDLENIGNVIREQSTKFIEETAKSIEIGAAALKTIDEKVSGDMSAMLPKLANMGIAIAGMGVLAGVAGSFSASNPEAAAAGFSAIKEISSLLEEAAVSLKEVGDKVPTDVGAIVAKLGSIGVGILGMGALVAVAGTLSSGREKEAKAGFQAIRDICVLLEEAAEPLQSVGDKVPTDLGAMVSKLGSMGIAIVGMGALVVIASKIPEGAEEGFSKILDINILLQETAETMGMIAEKIPSNLGEMASRLASMGIAIVGMGALGLIAMKLPDGIQEGFNKILDINILLQETAETMGMIAKKIPSNLGEMTSRLASMGIAIAGMGALGLIASKLPEGIQEGFSRILDINILLQETAETMGMVAEKIPADLGEMASRLASMGIAIAGMGALGLIATKLPEGIQEGFSRILDINILLQETAETMGMIAEKIPSNLGEMASRLASMGIAIAGMGALGLIATKLPEGIQEGFSRILDINILLQETAETMGMVAEKIPSNLGEMASRLASMGIAIAGMGALGFIASKLPDDIQEGFSRILDINILLQETAETMGMIASSIPSDLGAMASKLASMGIAIVGMGALVAIAGALAKKFPKEAKAGLEMMSGITTQLMTAAEAMALINSKVPANLEVMVEKLASMGIAIAGMGVLVGVVGKFAESNPLAALAGLMIIGEIVSLLTDTAEAMKQIDEKVPGNIEQVAEKLAAMGIAIGGMSAIVAAVGALVSTGIGALIAGAGLATVYAVAAELIHVSEAINQMDQNVPDDLSGIKGKIENIAAAIGYFTEANLGGVMDLFENAVGVLNTAVAAEGIMKLAEVGQELQKFEDITIPDNIETKINEIQGVFKYLQKGVGFLKEFGQVLTGGKVDTNIGEDAAKAIGNLASVAKSIQELEKFNMKDPKAVEKKIKMLQDTFQHFTKTKGLWADIGNFFDGGDIDTDIAKKAADYVTNLVKIADQLAKIEKTTLNYGTVLSKLQIIQDVLKSFDNFDVSMEIDSQILTDTVSKSDLLSQLVGHLETIMNFKFDDGAVGRFKVTVQSIKDAIEEVMSTDFTPKDENGNRKEMPDWTWSMEQDIQQAIDKLTKLNGMGEQLRIALDYGFDMGSFDRFEQAMLLMQEGISRVLKTDFTPKGDDGEDFDFGIWDEKTSPIAVAVQKLTKLNDMAAQLELALGFKFDDQATTDFSDTLGKVGQAVQMVASFKLGDYGNGTSSGTPVRKRGGDQEVGEDFGNSGDSGALTGDNFEVEVDNATQKVTQLNGLITSIQNVPLLSLEEFQAKTLAVKQCLAEISSFVMDEENINNAKTITSSADAFTKLAEELKLLLPQFTEFGQGFATNIMSQYNNDKPAEKVKEDFTQLEVDLRALITKFQEIGTGYKEGLVDTIVAAIPSIGDKLGEVVDGINTKDSPMMTKFRNIGAELGNAIIAGFSAAVEGLYVKVGSSNTPDFDIAKVGFQAKGGLVPQYLASGGLASIFKKKGTDTIPTMLTPGEFVQRKAAVQSFGLDFMSRVNNLDVPGAFRALTNRFGMQGMMPAVSTVVNNINHTTNNANRVTQHVVGGNADYLMKRVSRYLR